MTQVLSAFVAVGLVSSANAKDHIYLAQDYLLLMHKEGVTNSYTRKVNKSF